MQTNKTKFKSISSLRELYEMFSRKEYVIQNVHLYEEIAHIFYKDFDSLHEGSNDINVLACGRELTGISAFK